MADLEEGRAHIQQLDRDTKLIRAQDQKVFTIQARGGVSRSIGGELVGTGFCYLLRSAEGEEVEIEDSDIGHTFSECPE